MTEKSDVRDFITEQVDAGASSVTIVQRVIDEFSWDERQARDFVFEVLGSLEDHTPHSNEDE